MTKDRREHHHLTGVTRKPKDGFRDASDAIGTSFHSREADSGFFPSSFRHTRVVAVMRPPYAVQRRFDELFSVAQ